MGTTMTLETFRQSLLSFSIAEWAIVAVVVISFVAVTTTVGFVIGPIVGYSVVMLSRRAKRRGTAFEAEKSASTTK